MTKRNLFTTLAAIFVSAAFLAGCDHALSQQTASVSLLFGDPNGARAASRQAAGDAQEFPKVVVRIESGGGVLQERSEFYDNTNQDSGVEFNFVGLPVGTPLAVTAEYWNHDGIKEQEGFAATVLQPGANSLFVQTRRIEPEPETNSLLINVVSANGFDDISVTLTDIDTGNTYRGEELGQQINANVVTLRNVPNGTYTIEVTAYKGNDTYSGLDNDPLLITDLTLIVECEITVTQDPPPQTEGDLAINVKFDGGASYPSQPDDLTQNSEYAQKWKNKHDEYPIEFLIDVEITGDNGHSDTRHINSLSANGRAVEYSGGFAQPQFPFTFDNLDAGTYTVKVTATLNDCPSTRPSNSPPSGTYSGTATVQIPKDTTADVSMKYDKELPKLADVTATPPSDTGTTELTQGGRVAFTHDDPDAAIMLTVSTTVGVTHNGSPIGAEGVTGSGSIELTFNGAGTTYTVTAVASKSGYIPSRKEFVYTVQNPQPQTYTITIDGATASLDAISALSGGSHTVAVAGTLDDAALSAIASAIKAIPYGTTVSLDLSATTGLTSIGYEAFDGCATLAGIEIPNSVTSIGARAFYGCTELASIDIPNSVTEIGEQTFQDCTALMAVTIPNDSRLTTIVARTFWGCTSLAGIDIPNSVTKIGVYAFQNCAALTTLTLGSGLTTISDSAFEGCSALTEVTIPNNVREIFASAFQGCTELANLTLGSGLTTIGNAAFSRCAALTEVTIPDRVTEIPANAFSSCTALATVTLGNGLMTIGGSAFFGTALTTVRGNTDGWTKNDDGTLVQSVGELARELIAGTALTKR